MVDSRLGARLGGGALLLAALLLLVPVSRAPAEPDLGGGLGDLGGLDDDLGDLDGDFGDDLGGEFVDDFGDMSGPGDPLGDLGDLGDLDDLDGDHDFPSREDLEGEDPFSDPFPDPFPVGSGPVPPGASGAPVGSSAGDALTALEDLLHELRARGVARPLHGVARVRLRRWAAAADGEAWGGLPEDGGPGPFEPDAPFPGLPDLDPAGIDLDPGDLEGILEDPELEDPELGSFPEGLEARGELSLRAEALALAGADPSTELPLGSQARIERLRAGQLRGPEDLFRVFRLRREMARRILAPPSLSDWRTLLSDPWANEQELADGLGDLVGTRSGEEILDALVQGGLDLRGARALVLALGDHGRSADAPRLDLLARRFPSLAAEAARAEGRIEERARRGAGLDEEASRELAGVLLRQGAELAAVGRDREALAVLDEAAALRPGGAGVRLRLAIHAYQLGYFQRAREALESILRTGTREAVVYVTYAKVLRRQGDSETLVRVLEEAFRQGGGTSLKVRLANELALEHALRGDGAEAERLARIGLGYFVPEGAADNLWTRLAEGLALQGRLREALEAYDTALSLDPSYRKARLGRQAVAALSDDAARSWLGR